MKKLQERVPLLSEAERIMHKELTDMQYSLSRHTSGIQQVRVVLSLQIKVLTPTLIVRGATFCL